MEANLAIIILLSIILAISCVFGNDYSILDEILEHDSLTEPPKTFEINNPDEILLDPKGSYCQKTNIGINCDYSSTNKTVRISSGFSLAYGEHEIEIFNATELIVNPICISWIQIYNAQLVNTVQDANGDENCRTWLRIWNSTAGEISHGVKDLFIVNSYVNLIRLDDQRDFMAVNSTIDSLEYLSWKGYNGLIANSTIGEMTHLRAFDDLLVLNTSINKIHSGGFGFESDNLKMINVDFGELDWHSMEFVSGNVQIENCTFKMLEKFSIIIFPSARVRISNVQIENAVLPIFVVPILYDVVLFNISINGELVHDFSSLIVAEEDEYNSEEIRNDTSGCVLEGEILECTFNYSLKNSHYYLSGNEADWKIVIIRHAEQLSLNVCNREVILENCVITSIKTDQSESSDCKDLSLTIMNSTASIIDITRSSNVDIDNSILGDVVLEKIRNLYISNTKIHSMALNTVRNGSVTILESKIHLIVEAILKNPVYINDSTIETVSGIHISPETKCWITNSSLHYLPSKSFKLKKGTLFLNQVKLFSVSKGSFVLEPEALLDIKSQTPLPPRFKNFIVAHDYSQIDLDAPTFALPKKEFILLHRDFKSNENASENDIIIYSFENVYCAVLNIMTIECDFSEVFEQVEVNIKDYSPTLTSTLTLKNIKYLTLHPLCMLTVKLENVTSGRSLSKSTHCPNLLELKNSHLDELSEGWKMIESKNSSIKYLSISHPIFAIAINDTNITEIEQLHIKSSDLIQSYFSNSRIQDISFVEISNNLNIINSTIETINTFGLIVKSDLNLENSCIQYVNLSGIIVQNNVHIINSCFGKLENSSLVLIDYSIQMIDVTINQASLNFLKIESGNVDIKNISIGNNSIYMQKQLAWEDDSNYPKCDTAEPTSMSTSPTTTQSSTTTTTTTITPKVSARISLTPSVKTQTPLQDTIKAESNLTLPLLYGPDDDSSVAAVGWAGAVVGFFIGVLLSVSIMTVIQLCKDDHRVITPFHIRWRVKEDQQELISSEDEMDIHTAVREGF